MDPLLQRTPHNVCHIYGNLSVCSTRATTRRASKHFLIWQFVPPPVPFVFWKICWSILPGVYLMVSKRSHTRVCRRLANESKTWLNTLTYSPALVRNNHYYMNRYETFTPTDKRVSSHTLHLRNVARDQLITTSLSNAFFIASYEQMCTPSTNLTVFCITTLTRAVVQFAFILH